MWHLHTITYLFATARHRQVFVTTVSLLFWHRYHIAVLNLLQRIVQNYIRTWCRPQHARSWPQSFHPLQCTEKLNFNFAVLLLGAWWRDVRLFHFLGHLKFHGCHWNTLQPWIYSNAYIRNTAAPMKLLMGAISNNGKFQHWMKFNDSNSRAMILYYYFQITEATLWTFS